MSQRWLGRDTKKYTLLSRPPESLQPEGQHQNLQRCQWNHPFGEKEIQAWRHGCLSKLFEELPAVNLTCLEKQPQPRNTQDSAIPFSTQDVSTSQPKAVYPGQMRCHALHVVTFSYHSCIKSVEIRYGLWILKWVVTCLSELNFSSGIDLGRKPGSHTRSPARTWIKELIRFVTSFSSMNIMSSTSPKDICQGKIERKLSYKRIQRNVFCPSSLYQMMVSSYFYHYLPLAGLLLPVAAYRILIEEITSWG